MLESQVSDFALVLLRQLHSDVPSRTRKGSRHARFRLQHCSHRILCSGLHHSFLLQVSSRLPKLTLLVPRCWSAIKYCLEAFRIYLDSFPGHQLWSCDHRNSICTIVWRFDCHEGVFRTCRRGDCGMSSHIKFFSYSRQLLIVLLCRAALCTAWLGSVI